jgi:hypothetical protein
MRHSKVPLAAEDQLAIRPANGTSDKSLAGFSGIAPRCFQRTAPVLGSVWREEGAEIDGALPERLEALLPAVVEYKLAFRIEADVVAGDLVLLGLGPSELARIEV